MSNMHHRQTSVASFASSLYLPVDPENKLSFDDETEAYPSSDELFGIDHEEGDDYTISSRRHLSYSHSRYSSSAVSHPPTPPRSIASLERSPSSLSLTPPRARHSNPGGGSSPLAPILATATASTPTSLPSPPSTARSSNYAHSMDAPKPDAGVPIDKFDKLAMDHLEQDRALLRTLRKLDDQKVRIAQLTYALSRLRVLSNSECLSPSDLPIVPGSSRMVPVRRLGAVIPKPLIVQQSSKSASSSTFGRSTISSTRNASGLSGPSQNEAINQRRQAKQQLHEFALRRPTRNAKGRPIGRSTIDVSANQARRNWEGARGSASLVARESKPRAPGIVDHQNITVRRPKRPDPPRHFASQSARSPKSSAATPTTSPTTPPRLLSIFSSPSIVTSRSPQTPTQGQPSSFLVHDSPTTPVPNKYKPLPARPISPTKPMRIARNTSLTYTIPPVPSPQHTTAHITLVNDGDTTPPLPVEEVQNRLAATFAHFSSNKRASQSQVQREPSPPRRALEVSQPEGPGVEPEYLAELLNQKWVAQLDEHSHQARGSWKSPLRNIRQRIAGGLGIRKPSRASMSVDESEEGHTSLDGAGAGYVNGLGTVREGDSDAIGRVSGGPPVVDPKGKKLKKKGSTGTSEGAHQPPVSTALPPSSATATATPAATPKPSKSTWRFSRLGSSS